MKQVVGNLFCPHRGATPLTTIRIEVFPDDEGGWNVARDRVVLAGFDQKVHAERHAVKCCLTAALSGTGSHLSIMAKDGSLQQERVFAPSSQARRSTSLRRLPFHQVHSNRLH